MPNETVIYVVYRGAAESRFDRDYYVQSHVPLVERAFGPHGLLSAKAFFPPVSSDGTVAVCECRFRDDAALQAAFSSADAPAVMADVARFTDIQPQRVRVVPL